MAKPIREIRHIHVDDNVVREEKLTRVVDLLLEHEEAVSEGLELLGRLHEQGMLTMLNALLAKKDDVLPIIVKELNKPQHANMLSNLAELLLLVGSIDLVRIKPMFEGVQAGLEAAATGDYDVRTGMFEILKALKDPDISRAISMILHFLKTLGSELSGDDK